jgi:hypothetical protein
MDDDLWRQFKRSFDMLEIEHAFRVALRAAVRAERERCAQIAEGFIPSGFEGHIGVGRDDRARTIAAAIRRES